MLILSFGCLRFLRESCLLYAFLLGYLPSIFFGLFLQNLLTFICRTAYEKGNPFMSYNHIQICKVDPDCCVVKVNLVAESMNLHGHVHGGLLYAMADCVAGIFARMDGRDYVTQSAHINFLHNVQSGTIFAKAEIIKRGKHMAYFHISITDQDDHLLCDGMVDMYCISGCQT